MNLSIGRLDPGHAFGANGQMVKISDLEIKKISQYSLDNDSLSDINVLIIPNFVDQEFLYANKQVIENFLAAKKIIVFCGHLFRPWLPGASLFMPERIQHHTDYNVYPQNNTPIFEGVSTEDMTISKGVAGFFARGHYHVTDEQEVHLAFKSGHVVTYVDRTATNGTIVVHAGRPLLGYTGQNKTTDRIRPQFLAWLKQETARLQEAQA